MFRCLPAKQFITSIIFLCVYVFSFAQGKLTVSGAVMNAASAIYVSTKDVIVTNGGLLNVAASTLEVKDSITSSAGINLRYGNLEMSGGNSQLIPSGSFVINAVNNFIVNNASIPGIALGGSVDIYNSLTYAGSGQNLSTNDYLTIKSLAANTAWVGDMTGNTISGKVIVERFVIAHKGWRFLSIPTNTPQTIQQAWQEGATSSGSNPVAGFGIQLTGAGGTAAGFDSYSSQPSMKTYNSLTDTWIGVSNTNSLNIKTTTGYMTFVRGDRSVTSPFAPPTTTVVRTFGPLYTGDQAPVTVIANKFTAIGNPYASAIDMRNITKAGVKDFFYVWDPVLSGSNGYGGYQTFSNNGSGNYVITPGGGSYGAIASISNYIASGLAFFVQGDTTAGSVTFKEGAKTTGSGVSSIAQALPKPQLLVSLYGFNADSSTFVADGLMVNYDDSYSNKVDDMDAIKSANSSENLSVKNKNTLLVVERRHTIIAQDTIFLNLTGVSVQKYRFEIEADQLYQPGLTGFLEDAYLKTRTPLNIDGVTTYNFPMVNIAGAYAANRFRIVFAPPVVLPVTFTSLTAAPLNKDINVSWTVQNELNIKQYVVEKATDGASFATMATVAASANNSQSAIYNVLDTKPINGYNYYRVKSIDNTGQTAYTNVVKVLIHQGISNFIVTPNPVVMGKINLLFNNQPAGTYKIRILNNLGQPVIAKQIVHSDGNSIETIQMDTYVAHGIYQIEVTTPDKDIKMIEIIN
jgi:hypothetical protein